MADSATGPKIEIQKGSAPLVNPETAIEKLLKIANGIEADHVGRIAVAFRAVPQFGEC
jgi:hypothetical protein